MLPHRPLLPKAIVAVALLCEPQLASTSGAWRTVAGTGRSGFGGDTYHSSVHSFAVETRLNSPHGLALDAAFDRLYVSDTVNGVIRSVDLQTGLMEVIAGREQIGFGGDGQAAVDAELDGPTGLALDPIGRVLYISDTRNNRVRAMSLDPGRVYQAEENSTVPDPAGHPLPATVEVQGAQIRLTCPAAAGPEDTPLLLGSKFCEGSTGSGMVSYVDLIEEYIDFHVFASSGPGTYELRFRYADRYDAVHAGGDRLLRLIVNGAVITHALPIRQTGSLNAGSRTTFAWASHKAELSVVPPGVNLIRLETTGRGGPSVDQLYVVPPRTSIRTVAGTGQAGPKGCRNGCLADYPLEREAVASPLHHPLGLAFDTGAKFLYIADSENGRVLCLHVTTGMTETIAGGANTSSTRDGEVGGALRGKLFRPMGLALDSAGRYLYIADASDYRVRRVDLADPVATRTIVTMCGFGRGRAPFALSLRAPQSLALDEAGGKLYISDYEHARVRYIDIASGACLLDGVAQQLQCAYEGVDRMECVDTMGCCWNPTCLSVLNPDGRGPTAQPEDVLTKADQAASDPPISFVRGGAGLCCFPNLRNIETLDMLDTPGGLAWDPRENALYATQIRAAKVVKMEVVDSQCAANAALC